MNLKRYLILFTLFFVLLVSISAINAESDDSMENVTSTSDDSILQASADNATLNSQETPAVGSADNGDVSNSDSQLNAQKAPHQNQM